jgi:hypothetical protein
MDSSSQMFISVPVPIFGLVIIVKFCWKAHFTLKIQKDSTFKNNFKIIKICHQNLKTPWQMENIY